MKKNLIRFASVAMSVMASLVLLFSLNSCDGGGSDDDNPAPTITWSSNPTFQAMQIADSMNVELSVTSPNGITGFIITVDSPDAQFKTVLDGIVSEKNNSSNNNGIVVLDLLTDMKAMAFLGLLGVPTGTQLLNQTEVSLSLSKLVPMIKNVASTQGNYIFGITVTDMNGESTTKNATFYLGLSLE